jgi:RHS repeat-associated protein
VSKEQVVFKNTLMKGLYLGFSLLTTVVFGQNSTSTNPCSISLSGSTEVCLNKTGSYSADLSGCSSSTYQWSVTGPGTGASISSGASFSHTFDKEGSYTISVTAAGKTDTMTTRVYTNYIVVVEEDCVCLGSKFTPKVLNCEGVDVTDLATFAPSTKYNRNTFLTGKTGTSVSVGASVSGTTADPDSIDIVSLSSITASKTSIDVDEKIDLSIDIEPSSSCDLNVTWSAAKGTFSSTTGLAVKWTAPGEVDPNPEYIYVYATLCYENSNPIVKSKRIKVGALPSPSDKKLILDITDKLCIGENATGTAYTVDENGNKVEISVTWNKSNEKINFDNSDNNDIDGASVNVKPVSANFDDGDNAKNEVKIKITKSGYESDEKTITIYRDNTLIVPSKVCYEQAVEASAKLCKAGNYKIQVIDQSGSVKIENGDGSGGPTEIEFYASNDEEIPFTLTGTKMGYAQIKLLDYSGTVIDQLTIEVIDGEDLQIASDFCKLEAQTLTVTVCAEGEYEVSCDFPGDMTFTPSVFTISGTQTQQTITVVGLEAKEFTIELTKQDSSDVLASETVNVSGSVTLETEIEEHCISPESENCWKFTGKICAVSSSSSAPTKVEIIIDDQTILKTDNQFADVDSDGKFEFEVEALEEGTAKVKVTTDDGESREITVTITKVEWESVNNTEGHTWEDISHIAGGGNSDMTVEIEIVPEGDAVIEVINWVMNRHDVSQNTCGNSYGNLAQANGTSPLSNGDNVTPNGTSCVVDYTKDPKLAYTIVAWVKCEGEDDDKAVPVSHSISTSYQERNITIFTPNSKYRNVNLYGQPSTVVRPQQESESDQSKPGFNIDTYSLSPIYTTTDISIPLRGSDLKLEVKRTASQDIEYENVCLTNNIFDPWKNVLGYGWRSNLTAVVKKNDEGFTVIDESGSAYQYYLNGQPKKENFSNHEASHHKVLAIGNTFIWKKKFGTTYKFSRVSVNDGGGNGGGNNGGGGTNCPTPGSGGGSSGGGSHTRHYWRVFSIADRNGNELIYTYVPGLLFPTKIHYKQNPELAIEFTYNGKHLATAKDPMGRIYRYNFNIAGQLALVTQPPVPVWDENDPGNPTITSPQYSYTYDVLQTYDNATVRYHTCLKTITDPEQNTTSLTYGVFNQATTGAWVGLVSLDSPGPISTIRSVVNFSTAGTFFNRINTVTDANHHTWRYAFTTANVILSNGGEELVLDNFSRTLNGSKTMTAHFSTDITSGAINLSQVIDYEGNKAQYVYGLHNGYNYSDLGQPYQEIIDPNGLAITKQYEYEPTFNQMSGIVDSRAFSEGNVNDFTTTYDFDGFGNRVAEHAPEGKNTFFQYANGFQTKAVDGDGRTTLSKRIYHANGWDDITVASLKYNDQRSFDDLNLDLTNYQPTPDDNLIVVIKKYDLVGNLIYTIDANGNTTENVYDNLNGLAFTISAQVFDYDSAQDASGINLIYRDLNRQITAIQDPRGNWTYTRYNGATRPVENRIAVSINNMDDIVTRFVYDSVGNKERVIDPRNVITDFEYDAFNNLTKEIKDVGGLNLTSTFFYGENSGNDLFGDTGFVPTKKVDPRGLVTKLEYDNAYRLVKTYRGKAGKEALLSQISYDTSGNVIKTISYNNKLSDINGDYLAGDPLLLGNQETITVYDKLNRPVKTALDLDGDGASVTDNDDIITMTVYDSVGNVVIGIDPELHSTQTEYDAAGRIVKQVTNLDDSPDFSTVNGNSYTINASAEDIVTTKFYDDNGNALTETLINDTVGSAGTQTITKSYDALNRVTEAIDSENYSTYTEYDLKNNVRAATNARNHTSIIEYDEANRPIKQILPEVYDAESQQDVNPQVTTLYDATSNVVETIDARALKVVNEYDTLNRLTKTTQILGATESAVENIVSEFSYDANNNQTSSKLHRDDRVLTTSTVYDSLDRPFIVKDAEGYSSVVLSDLIGNKVKIYDKRSNTNVDGTLSSTPQLRYSTDMSFDRANRVVKNTLPEVPVATRSVLGTVVVTQERPFSTVTYLKNNWITETLDLNGNISKIEYDAAGRKEKITNSINQNLVYTYDKAGNILTQDVDNNLASGGNQLTSYSYDKRNLPLSETLNLGDASFERGYTYTYDGNGNKKSRVLPNLDLTTYNYDSLDRLIQEVYGNATEENRTYQYNNNGAVITSTDNTGRLTYEYDLLGRQTFERKFNTANTEISLVESIYDKANNRIRCYLPYDKKTLLSTYDSRNLLVELNAYNGKHSLGNEPTESELTSYLYDANGLQVSCELPNGQITTKSYDSADRILSSSTSNGLINGYLATYKRDAVGNQLQTIETRSAANTATDKVRTLDFIYDDIYRLTTESDDVTGELVTSTYYYDLQGNRLSKTKESGIGQDTWTYTNDILNRTTQVNISLAEGEISSYSYEYDLNGNRSLRNYTDTESVVRIQAYTYDQENRLSSVVENSDVIFKASYDYRTRRTAKTETLNGGPASTVSYLYDGGVSCQEMKLVSGNEFDGTNAVLDKQYIRGNGMGGGIGSVLYMERAADIASTSQSVQDFYDNLNGGQTTSLIPEYYTYNAVGSVVANTDQDGYVIRENDFDAYGNIVREEDLTTNNFPIEFGGSQNDLLFSTKERDFSTGLDYFGFRYYDSVLGKFITRDPSGYPDGPNNYLYVNNNPINSIDPLGLKTKRKVEQAHDDVEYKKQLMEIQQRKVNKYAKRYGVDSEITQKAVGALINAAADLQVSIIKYAETSAEYLESHNVFSGDFDLATDVYRYSGKIGVLDMSQNDDLNNALDRIQSEANITISEYTKSIDRTTMVRNIADGIGVATGVGGVVKMVVQKAGKKIIITVASAVALQAAAEGMRRSGVSNEKVDLAMRGLSLTMLCVARFYDVKGGRNSQTQDKFVGHGHKRHRYKPDKVSSRSTTQYGKNVNVKKIREKTMNNPDSVKKQYDKDGNHIATIYKKRFGSNISTKDTPSRESRVIINHQDSGASTQFPFYKNGVTDKF